MLCCPFLFSVALQMITYHGTPEDKAQYEDEYIKKIVDSFEYRGVVEYPEEEEKTEK